MSKEKKNEQLTEDELVALRNLHHIMQRADLQFKHIVQLAQLKQTVNLRDARCQLLNMQHQLEESPDHDFFEGSDLNWMLNVYHFLTELDICEEEEF